MSREKTILALSITVLVGFLTGCNLNLFQNWGGQQVTVQEIRFVSASSESSRSSARSLAGESGLIVQEALTEPLDGKTVVSTDSYGFREFKFVSDIMLRSATEPESGSSNFSLLRWGGDPDDLSRYIDLVSGKVFSGDDEQTLPAARFESILLQINAPGKTIVPDFGGAHAEMAQSYSWTDVKPFSSTESSAQSFLLSTFIDTATVKWLGGQSDEIEQALSGIDIVTEYNETAEHPITDLAGWVYSEVPLTEDFFALLKTHEYSSDPQSGEAWVLLPLNAAIDLTAVTGDCAIEFDFELGDMFEVHTTDTGEVIPMISSTKVYTDSDGFVRYSPFPAVVSVEQIAIQ